MTKHIDPVCGKHINVNKAHIVIHYQGEDFYLCCPQCQKEFELNPLKYAIKKQKSKRR